MFFLPIIAMAGIIKRRRIELCNSLTREPTEGKWKRASTVH